MTPFKGLDEVIKNYYKLVVGNFNARTGKEPTKGIVGTYGEILLKDLWQL